MVSKSPLSSRALFKLVAEAGTFTQKLFGDFGAGNNECIKILPLLLKRFIHVEGKCSKRHLRNLIGKRRRRVKG